MPELGSTFDFSTVIQPALDFAADMWAQLWPLVALMLGLGLAAALLEFVFSWWYRGPGGTHKQVDDSVEKFHGLQGMNRRGDPDLSDVPDKW